MDASCNVPYDEGYMTTQNHGHLVSTIGSSNKVFKMHTFMGQVTASAHCSEGMRVPHSSECTGVLPGP